MLALLVVVGVGLVQWLAPERREYDTGREQAFILEMRTARFHSEETERTIALMSDADILDSGKQVCGWFDEHGPFRAMRAVEDQYGTQSEQRSLLVSLAVQASRVLCPEHYDEYMAWTRTI